MGRILCWLGIHAIDRAEYRRSRTRMARMGINPNLVARHCPRCGRFY